MGTEGTFKLLLEFSVPAVAGVLVQMLYNVIDAVYVGHAVGADGLAATTVANPTMTALVAVAMLVGVGGNALAAIKLGERRKDVAERVMGTSLVLLLGAAALLWAAAPLTLEPVLRCSGADGAVLPLALDFMAVIIAGCPLQFISFGMNNFIRTAGRPNRALGSMLVGTASNVVLGYLFIVVLDGGMRGAGLATVCSWGVSAAFVMQFFLKKDSPLPLVGPLRSFRPRMALRICALGMAPAVAELGWAVSSMIINNLLVSYGSADDLGSDGALAIMRVLSAVGMFTFMPSMGIAMGAQPIIGYNYGARSFRRMKRALVQAIVLGVVVTTPLWATVVFAPDMYAHLFGLPERYLDETAWALVLYLMFIPILPVQIIGSNYFDATGQAVKATVLTLTRQILFLIPLLLVCPIALPHLLPVTPLESVWLAPSLSDITSTLIVSGFLAAEWRRLGRIRLAAESDERSSGERAGKRLP
ncbi:MATE family efflux transporter [Gordonibacter sp. An230]|uniref:MATE family efflux transporter n=1 Tax=Gordonibacter sp. An230 TaxID=1965592 RepID=UPI001EF64496|nr:MATE family efflux transporter [Gordonibacter sp. An230]